MTVLAFALGVVGVTVAGVIGYLEHTGMNSSKQVRVLGNVCLAVGLLGLFASFFV